MEFKNIPPGSAKYQNFRYVWNSFWLVVVTMSTGIVNASLIFVVGFGDLYPITHFGRLVIVIASFWGMFLVSQFVYVMETSSRFTHSQAKAFELLQRLRQRAELKKDAAMLIKAWWKHRRVVKAIKSKSEAGGGT